MTQIHFYATKEDLLPMLETLESKGNVKYVLRGIFAEPSVIALDHGKDIQNLGSATTDASVSCEAFLVCEPELQIFPRSVEVLGEERFFIDQLYNPKTVTFTPAGMWNPDTLLEGSVTTASDLQESQRLMKRFHSAIKKHFVKVKGYWVGPEALKFLQSGKRLTVAVRSPEEYNLSTSS